MKNLYRTREGLRFIFYGKYISDTDHVKAKENPMIRKMIKDGDLFEVDKPVKKVKVKAKVGE